LISAWLLERQLEKYFARDKDVNTQINNQQTEINQMRELVAKCMQEK